MPRPSVATMDTRPFISGTVAGVIAGFVGHPLDTIRVRVQTHQGVSGSAISIARDLVKKEGTRALLKGLAPQMIGYCTTSAIRFGVFGNTKSSNTKLITALAKGLDAGVSGAKAGVALSPIISVLELLKCRQQVSRQVVQPPLRDVLRHLLQTEGVRGLGCGYAACLPRNICGNGSMFGIFELLKCQVDEHWAPTGMAKGAAYVGCSIIGGGMSWLIVFPLDLIKTNIVTVADPTQRPSFRTVATKLWAEEGLPGLYRGLGTTILRSIPVNAVYLPTFVLVNDALHMGVFG